MAELAQTEQRVLPAPAVEAASKVYLEDLAKGIGAARTVDLSKIYGPSFVAPESQFTQQAYQPLNVAERYGAGIQPLISGQLGSQTFSSTVTPTPSPLQNILSIGGTLASIYGRKY